MPITGIYSSTGFLFDVASETSFNSGTKGTDYGALGIMTKFTSYELDNAWTEAYEIGQRYPQAYYTAGLSAPVAFDFYACQDQIGWLGFVLGAAAGGTYTVGSSIQTGMVQLMTPQSNLFTLGGIAFSTCKFNVTTGSPVTISLNGTGTSFSSAPGTISAGAVPSQLLTWKDCSLSTVGATITPGLIQSFNFTIDTGAKQYYAIGSPFYQTYLPLQSKVTAELVAFHNDNDWLVDVFDYLVAAGGTLGPGSPGTVLPGGTIVMNIGSHTATFTGCYLTKGVLGLEPVKEVMTTLDFSAINVQIV